MNVLEQLQAMGFREEPMQFFEGGDADSAAANDAAAAAADIGDAGPGDSIGHVGPISTESGIVVDASGAPVVGIGTPAPSASAPGAEVLALLEAIEAGLDVGGPGVAQAAQNAISGNLTPSDIEALNAAGLGSATGFNINNPTQSLEEMENAQQIASLIQEIGIPALMNAVPGAGLAMSIGKGAVGLATGQISPGMTAVNLSIEALANQLGLPSSTISSALNGNFGAPIAQQLAGIVQAQVAQSLNVPPSLINIGLNLTGLNKDVSQAAQTLGSSINQALGSTPTNNVAMLGKSIDEALGFTPSPAPAPGAAAPSASAIGEQASTTDQAAPETKTAEGMDIFKTLGALGFGSQEDQDQYELAPITSKSPFGLMYGLDKSGPYGIRG